MSLTISNTILDEEFRTTQTGTADDNDVLLATFTSSPVATALSALSLTFASGFSGFPQYAEKTSFVNIGAQVTDFSLTASGGGALSGVATDLYVGSNQVFLYSTSDPNIVIGRIGTGTTANAGGNVALVIALDETKSGGFVTDANIWIGLYAPVVHDGLNLTDSADTLDLSGLIYLKSSFDTTTTVPFSDFSKVPSGNNTFDVIFPTGVNTDLQLLVTGAQGETQKQVAVSTQGIGAGAQHVENGVSLRIDTVNGFIQSNVDSNAECVASAIDYTGHVDIVDASFQITQVNPSSPSARADLTIFAFQVSGNAQEQAFLNDAIATDGTPVQIDAADVKIYLGSTDITALFVMSVASGGYGGSITQNGDGVTITGLDDPMQVKFATDGVKFDRFLVTNVDSKETFDVGNILVTTVTGGPGSESAELGSHLIFQDDGPQITASGATLSALTADDSTLGTDPTGSFAGAFNAPDYGADGQGTITYTLGISGAGAATGLTETSSGDAVFLFLESGKVVGRSGDNSTLAASGPIVFEISVDSSGTVKLDEKSAVVHSNSGSNDESTAALTASLITLTATVTDSEAANQNDSASASVSIGDMFLFKDDGPGIGPSTDVSAPNDLQVANKTDSTGQDSSFYVLTPGNDGLQSFTIQGPADSSGDFTWQYYDVDGSGTAGLDEIKGFYKGSALYTLEVNSDGTYTVKMIGTLPSSSLDLNPAEVIKAGAPNDPILQIGAVQNDDYVQMTADSTIGTGNINESHGFVGVDNGNVDVGESLTFTLHESDGDLISFQGIQIGTKSAQGGQYSWTAHLAGGGTISSSTNEVVGKNGTIIIDATDLGGATIDSITVTKVSGSAIKIGVSDIHIIVLPDDVQLGFTVVEKDGDNDVVTASFVVDIDGNNDGVYDATVNSLSVINPASVEFSALASPLERQHDFHQHDYFLV